jgi:predicted membrane chloride channel (bestrophin family)
MKKLKNKFFEQFSLAILAQRDFIFFCLLLSIYLKISNDYDFLTLFFSTIIGVTLLINGFKTIGEKL